MYCLHILHDQVHGSGHQLKDGEKWRIWGEDWFLEDNRWPAAFVFPPINIRFNDTIHQEIMVNGHLLSCKLWLECGDEKSWCQASLTSSLMASHTGENTSSLKSLEFSFDDNKLQPPGQLNRTLENAERSLLPLVLTAAPGHLYWTLEDTERSLLPLILTAVLDCSTEHLWNKSPSPTHLASSSA